MSVDLKNLKKLANACRKAGITYFKSADFEFSLDASPQKIQTRRSKVNAGELKEDEAPKSDSLSPEELLFWSTGVIEEATKDQ